MLKTLKEKFKILGLVLKDCLRPVYVVLVFVGLLILVGLLFTKLPLKIISSSSLSIWTLLVGIILILILESFVSLNQWVKRGASGLAIILASIGVLRFLLLGPGFVVFIALKAALTPQEIHFVESVTSPDGQKQAIIYIQEPKLSTAQPTYSVDIKYPAKAKKLFVANTSCRLGFEVKWFDNETITINDKKFKINQDTRHEDCPGGPY
jgi:hypothetical protein